MSYSDVSSVIVMALRHRSKNGFKMAAYCRAVIHSSEDRMCTHTHSGVSLTCIQSSDQSGALAETLVISPFDHCFQ